MNAALVPMVKMQINIEFYMGNINSQQFSEQKTDQKFLTEIFIT